MGLEAVRQLSKLPHARIYLGSRDVASGEKAKQEAGLPDSVHVRELDVASQESVDAFVEYLKKEHGEKSLKALINNAGVAPNSDEMAKLRTNLDVNYWGTKRMMDAFRMLVIPKTGRMVNVLSRVGVIQLFPDGDLKKMLESPTNVEEVDAAARDFAERGSEEMPGWYPMSYKQPTRFYFGSKALECALTRLYATKVLATDDVPVIGVCPGGVGTDMYKAMFEKGADQNPFMADKRVADFLATHLPVNSTEEGTKVFIWAATHENPAELNGKFYGENKELSYMSGQYV